MTSKDVFLSYLQEKTALTNSEWDILFANFQEKTVPKGTVIHQSGDVCKTFYFLCDGLVKVQALKEKRARVVDFINMPCFFTDLISIDHNTPSSYSFSCISDVRLLSISADKLRTLYTTSFATEHLGRKIAEQLFVVYMKYINDYIFYTPEQRYLTLIKNAPEVLRYVPQQELASYLGITPSAFSRLKHRVFKKPSIRG
jgi:CRP-like cAMP-binding protein